MDERAQKELDAILAKGADELNEYEKAVLRARLSYVGRRSREKFAKVLAEVPQPKQEATTEDETTDGEKKPASDPNNPFDNQDEELDDDGVDEDLDESE